jgi:ankyrin repeat protein
VKYYREVAAKIAEILLNNGAEYNDDDETATEQDKSENIPHKLHELLMEKRQEHKLRQADSWKFSTEADMPLLYYVVRTSNKTALQARLEDKGSRSPNHCRTAALCLAIVLYANKSCTDFEKQAKLNVLWCLIDNVEPEDIKKGIDFKQANTGGSDIAEAKGVKELPAKSVYYVPEFEQFRGMKGGIKEKAVTALDIAMNLQLADVVLKLLEKLLQDKLLDAIGDSSDDQELLKYHDTLMWAISRGAAEVVGFLLNRILSRTSAKFASLPFPDAQGSSQEATRRNLYHYAAEAHDRADELIMLFLSLHSAEDRSLLYSTDEHGRSALHIAAKNVNIKAVEELCKRIKEIVGKTHPERALEEINRKDQQLGYTPLHAVIEALRTEARNPAVKDNAKKCTSTLLNYHADISTKKDKSDRTAIQLAEEGGHDLQDLVFLMLQKRQGTDTKNEERHHRIGKGLLLISNYLDFQKRQYVEAKELREYQLNRMMLPAIFTATVATVLGLALKPFQWGAVVVSTITGLNGFLLAVVQHLKLDAQAEAHRITSHHFDRLTTMAEYHSQQLRLFPSNDHADQAQRFIQELQKEVKDIKQANQFVVPSSIREKNLASLNAFKVEWAKQFDTTPAIMDEALPPSRNAAVSEAMALSAGATLAFSFLCAAIAYLLIDILQPSSAIRFVVIVIAVLLPTAMAAVAVVWTRRQWMRERNFGEMRLQVPKQPEDGHIINLESEVPPTLRQISEFCVDQLQLDGSMPPAKVVRQAASVLNIEEFGSDRRRKELMKLAQECYCQLSQRKQKQSVNKASAKADNTLDSWIRENKLEAHRDVLSDFFSSLADINEIEEEEVDELIIDGRMSKLNGRRLREAILRTKNGTSTIRNNHRGKALSPKGPMKRSKVVPAYEETSIEDHQRTPLGSSSPSFKSLAADRTQSPINSKIDSKTASNLSLNTWLEKHKLDVYGETLSLCVSTISEINDFDAEELDEVIIKCNMSKLDARIFRKAVEHMQNIV